MNILHVTPYYAPAYAFGGVVRAVEGLARAQVEAGQRVTILTTDALSPSRRFRGATNETRDGVHIVRLRNLLPRGTLNVSTPGGIWKLARPHIEWADIIHCHEFRTVENLFVTPMAAELNKPLVLSPHGTLTYAAGRSRVKAGWDALFSRRLARRFTVVIGLTDAEADDARGLWRQLGATGTNFAVVPNGVNPGDFAELSGGAAFRARYGLGEGPVVLFLGRVHPRKGAHLLAEAFARVNLPEARLVIAGPDEGGLTRVEPHRDARMIVTDYLAENERLDALAAADVFALPAIGEGLSMALLEALAAGLPALIAPEMHLPEIAEAGAGVIVARDPAEIAAALAHLLTQPDERAAMGEAARRLVRERFTWAAVAAQMGAVYDDALRRG